MCRFYRKIKMLSKNSTVKLTKLNGSLELALGISNTFKSIFKSLRCFWKFLAFWNDPKVDLEQFYQHVANKCIKC